MHSKSQNRFRQVFVGGTCLLLIGLLTLTVYYQQKIQVQLPVMESTVVLPHLLNSGMKTIQTYTPRVASKTYYCDITENNRSPYCNNRRTPVFNKVWKTWKRDLPDRRYCEEHCNGKRFLVFLCSPGQTCGGFANRQRGIVTIFLLARFLDRRFAIIHNKGCELTEYLDYNTYDWYGCNSCLKINDTSMAYNFIDDIGFTKKVANFDFESLFTKDVEFVRTNRYWELELTRRPDAKVALREFQNKTHYEIYNKVLTMLFKPKDKLTDFVGSFLKQYKDNHKLVCAQLRNVKHFTSEVVRIPHPEDVYSFLDRFNRTKINNIFIASDSNALKKIAQKRYGEHFVTVPGNIIHTDFAKRAEDACHGLFMTLADQLILSQCDVNLVINSGVGLYAQYMRPNLEHMYCYDHYVSRYIINCTQNDFWRLWLSTDGWKRYGKAFQNYTRSLHLKPLSFVPTNMTNSNST